MRLPLIDGQGNFGSMDGDPPAAMRYTEARLGRVARELLDDIDKILSIFSPTMTKQQRANSSSGWNSPIYWYGGGGIAVGIATSIPPHNLVKLSMHAVR